MKVDIDYLTVWNAMNDLEELSAKLVSIRSIIRATSDAASNDDVDQAKNLSDAAVEFLDWYIQSWDEKFTLAWNQTVSTIKRAEWDALKGNDRYTEEEMNAMCDKAAQDEKHSKHYYDYTRNDPNRENPFISQNGMTYDEAVASGWTMTADGFWIKMDDC